MQEELTSTLKKMLVTNLFVETPEGQIGEDDGLQSVLGLDSVGFLELRVLCEERFQVRITDEDFNPDNFRTVGKLASFITQLKSSQESVA
ncbi:acyl carrier protein [Corallococcus sp. H22C18031201]|uniref:acyl carrier protein n=1 Tax=Citreicoccus inhibens TaxID=2849499 RepID=UPI000E76381D|nr:acyl carrier protein [Citreicoccus inhibens]MBU8894109.1 acyl carrier protein [Citreicoccus inhibens]RJS23180.1 acyl carrier protein [Corallococcus sp. H22C18031201]